jgi:hypothetical protein
MGSKIVEQNLPQERPLTVHSRHSGKFPERRLCSNYGRSRHAICTTEFGQKSPSEARLGNDCFQYIPEVDIETFQVRYGALSRR